MWERVARGIMVSVGAQLVNAEKFHPAMQALIPKSSCMPPRGATRVMLSTEGTKAARWHLNQPDHRWGGLFDSLEC